MICRSQILKSSLSDLPLMHLMLHDNWKIVGRVDLSGNIGVGVATPFEKEVNGSKFRSANTIFGRCWVNCSCLV